MPPPLLMGIDMTATATKATEKVPETAIFFARAMKYQIGNFVKEKREGSHLVQGEESVRFEDNLLVTSDPKVKKFVRANKRFGIAIHECETMAEALKMKAKHQQRRGLREVKTQDITSTEIRG